jgi:hypothetical protein
MAIGHRNRRMDFWLLAERSVWVGASGSFQDTHPATPTIIYHLVKIGVDDFLQQHHQPFPKKNPFQVALMESTSSPLGFSVAVTAFLGLQGVNSHVHLRFNWHPQPFPLHPQITFLFIYFNMNQIYLASNACALIELVWIIINSATGTSFMELTSPFFI